jgi:ankyrin repeat protein
MRLSQKSARQRYYINLYREHKEIIYDFDEKYKHPSVNELMYAVQYGSLNFIKKAFIGRYSTTYVPSYLLTAISHMATTSNVETVEFFLEKTDTVPENILINAIINHCPKDLLKKIVHKAMASNVNLDSSLERALNEGHFDIADILYSYGATIVNYDSFFTNANIKVIQYLIEKGFNINQKDSSGRTPLFYTNEETFAYLIERGADVTIVTNDGKNIFHEKFSIILKFNLVGPLVQKGVDINRRDGNGIYPILNLLGSSSFFDALNKECSLDELKQFIEHGANLSAVDNNGNTVLHFAISNITTHEDVLRYLLDTTNLLNVKNIRGLTPLMYSVSHFGIRADIFLEYKNKIDLSVTDNSGKTVFDLVLEKGHYNLLKIFKKQGFIIPIDIYQKAKLQNQKDKALKDKVDDIRLH